MSSLSEIEIARIVEFGEAEAWADMYAAAPPELGLRVERFGSAVALVAPKLPMILFNRVIGLGLNEPITGELITKIAELYTNAEAATYAIQLPPNIQNAELTGWMQTHRLLPRDNWSKVYRKPDTTVSVPTDLRVERVGREHGAECASIAREAFEMPPFLDAWFANLVGRTGWQHYLSFDGDTAVGTGVIFIKEGIGWLSLGGTRPAYRKRGSQGEIMARRIRDAALADCDWVITETDEDTPEHSNPSYHNMRRTGFNLAYPRRNYIFEVAGYQYPTSFDPS